ncbi:ABC transporter ATP-binding protein [Pseudonocardia xinjiangensis]|uniref:ABC transporter ATP-binding protein n=1 Tax=Pseudonocardia xinjiangensis TaxID=75289 RepID=UPI0028AA1007|nr:ABC transporter ATP-binding protein [Pseudonocardia xinjiangensis]
MLRTQVIRLAGVRKRYRGHGEVLAGVDLDVAAGRPVAVVGGNGAGKSTLLRIAAGCTAPTAGTVSGRPRVVGFLPGRFPASSRMPVRAYLHHLAALHGVPRADAGRDADELLDALGFTGDASAPVALLSTGNAQKVGLAQALTCRADLLVLDEPWSGLDATAAAALDLRLEAECARGAAMLLADHSGRAGALPGATVLRLADGVLTPAAMDAGTDAADGVQTVVELRCPGDPTDVLRALPPVAECWTVRGQLTVRVPAERGDALLAAALAAGCSVLAVWREEVR